MLHGVLLKSLRDVRRSFAWWSLGLAGYVVLIVGLWPTVRDNPALAELEESYPEELQAFFSFGGFDISTAPGYLGAELFSLHGAAPLRSPRVGAGSTSDRSGRGTGHARPTARRIRSRGVGSRSRRLPRWRSSWPRPRGRPVRHARARDDCGRHGHPLGNLASATTSAFLLGVASGCSRSRWARRPAGSSLAIGLSAAAAVAAISSMGSRRSSMPSTASVGSRPGTTTRPTTHCARACRRERAGPRCDRRGSARGRRRDLRSPGRRGLQLRTGLTSVAAS